MTGHCREGLFFLFDTRDDLPVGSPWRSVAPTVGEEALPDVRLALSASVEHPTPWNNKASDSALITSVGDQKSLVE